MGRLLRNFPCFQEANDAWHANCGRGNERSRSRGGIGRLLHGVARRVDLHTFLGRITENLVFVVIDGLLDVVVVFAAYQQGVVESALGVGRWIGEERSEVDGRRRRSRRWPGLCTALFLDAVEAVEGEVGGCVGEVGTLRFLLALLPLLFVIFLLFLLLLLSSLFVVVVVPTLSIVVVVVIPWHLRRWDEEEGRGDVESERER